MLLVCAPYIRAMLRAYLVLFITVYAVPIEVNLATGVLYMY